MLLPLIALAVLSAPAQERSPGAGPIQLPDKRSVKVRDFAIQLHSLDIAKLKASATDLLVIDPYGDPKPLSAPQVGTLKTGPRGRRMVMAYLPISEVNARSPLWNSKWDANNDGHPDAGAPAWLEDRKPDGNYAVRYWNPDWQQLLHKSKDSLISKVVKLGFDGMVLDPGEALDTKELPKKQTEQVVGKLLMAMTGAGRAAKPRFVVLGMNPEEMMEYASVVLMFDGVLVDGLYYGSEHDSEASPESYIKEHEGDLKELAEERRLILTVAYTRDPAQIKANDRRARANGFVPFASLRGLDKLPTNE